MLFLYSFLMLVASVWVLTVFCWWRHNFFFFLTGPVIHTGRQSLHFDSRCASWTCEWECVSPSRLENVATHCLCSKLTHMLYVVTALCGCWVVLLTWTGRATGRMTSEECEMFSCVFCCWHLKGKQVREDDWLFGRLSVDSFMPGRRRHKDFCCLLLSLTADADLFFLGYAVHL